MSSSPYSVKHVLVGGVWSEEMGWGNTRLGGGGGGSNLNGVNGVLNNKTCQSVAMKACVCGGGGEGWGGGVSSP